MTFSYTGDPLNNPMDALRLMLGDLDEFDPLFQDEELDYFLTLANDVVQVAFYSILPMILPRFTRFARERAGQIEVYGGDYFNNWLAWIKLLLKPTSPTFQLIDGGMYFGGVDRAQSQAFFLDPSIVDQPFYRGQFFRMPNNMGYRRLTPTGFAEVDETGRLVGFNRVALPEVVDSQDQPDGGVGEG